jgi:hypothetical protein
MYLHTSNIPRKYIYTFPEKEVSNQLHATPISDKEKGAPPPPYEWSKGCSAPELAELLSRENFLKLKFLPITAASDLSWLPTST